jgi:hypothetical protein
VDRGVIDRLDPGREQPGELGQTADARGDLLGDLDQELLAHGAEKPFDFPSALGPAGRGVHQLDAQAGAGAQQPRVDK